MARIERGGAAVTLHRADGMATLQQNPAEAGLQLRVIRPKRRCPGDRPLGAFVIPEPEENLAEKGVQIGVLRRLMNGALQRLDCSPRAALLQEPHCTLGEYWHEVSRAGRGASRLRVA